MTQPWSSSLACAHSITVASRLAGSYVDTAGTGAGLVADQAADRKTAKYVDLRAQYVFLPVSAENPGPFIQSNSLKTGRFRARSTASVHDSRSESRLWGWAV